MSKNENKSTPRVSANGPDGDNRGNGRSTNLEDSPMMAHMLDALKKGKDIGHFGRLTFVMVARHFMSKDEMVKLLAKQPGQDEQESRALVLQVEAHDYNPPRREQVLEWQAQQDFPICPTPDDPNSCNIYSDLQFPEGIYDNIQDFYEEQAQAEA